MMRIHYTLLTLAFAFATSCNQKQAKENDTHSPVDSLASHETIDSTEAVQDSLAYCTEDDIARQNGALVEVAQLVRQMKHNDCVSPSIDFTVKEVERINPKLVAYFDRHHKSQNMSEGQKIDSVLNEINVVYEQMLEGSTTSCIVGLDVHIAVESYREVVLFSRMLRMAKNANLRAALRDEMVRWRTFEHDLTSYVSNVAKLCFWGGSLSGPASLMAYRGVLRSRIEDQNNLCALMVGKKGPKSGKTPKQAESVFRKSIQQALDSVFYEDHSEIFVEGNDSLYLEMYKETQILQSDVNSSLPQWLKARKRLGLVANLPQNEWRRATAALLTRLSKETTYAATY